MHYAPHVSKLMVPCQEFSCCWYVDIKAAIFTNTARQQQGTSDIWSHVNMSETQQKLLVMDQKDLKMQGMVQKAVTDTIMWIRW
jgi:hypothetical protein